MITDRLDLCPFCSQKLIKHVYSVTEWALDCPQEHTHYKNLIWAYFDDKSKPNHITAFNIRVGRYQFLWNFDSNKFALLDIDSDNGGRDTIFTSNELIDFPLDQETIERKIKTILVFH